MLVFYSFSGNSLVYLIVWLRQKFPLVSVIIVVGLANLSCCCDHCVNVANQPDTKNVRQRTPPSELILFWSHVTSVFQGLSLSRSVGWVGENPGNEVVTIPHSMNLGKAHFPCGGGRGTGARENRGRDGTGDGRRKGRRRDLCDGGKRERIQKGKLLLFVTAYFQSKKRPQERFLTSI